MFFDNWSQLGGPRGAQVAARLYGVLDAGGDGKLDFQVRLRFLRVLSCYHTAKAVAVVYQVPVVPWYLSQLTASTADADVTPFSYLVVLPDTPGV